MAVKVKKFEHEPSGKNGKYPWDQWTDGSIWEVREGQDFNAKAEFWRGNLYSAAQRHNMSVRSITLDNGKRIQFQFVAKTGPTVKR